MKKAISSISNQLFDGNIEYSATTNAGIYTVYLENINEKLDNIKDGSKIEISFSGKNGTCTAGNKPDVKPNLEYSKEMINELNGDIMGEFSTTDTKITFTFNELNNDFKFINSSMMFSWDINVLSEDANIDLPCNLEMNVFDDLGTNVYSTTEEVVVNKPEVTANEIAIDWSLSDTFTKYNNIISPGSSVSNRRQLDSKSYYPGLGVSDPKGGIIETGSKYVGQRIGINLRNNRYSDIQNADLTFTLPQETSMTTNNFHVVVLDDNDIKKEITPL